MADRSNYGNWEIACVAKTGHDNGEPEELRRGVTNDGDYVSKSTAYSGANEHIDGHKPPKQDIINGDRLAEMDKNEAGKEEGEDKLAKKFECGLRNDLGSMVCEDEANHRKAQ